MATERAGISALRAAVADASADGFANVTQTQVGPRLRAAVADLVQVRPDDADLSALAASLDGFDRLGRQDRSVIVARAQRVCLTWAMADPAPKKPRRPDKRAPAVGAERTPAPATQTCAAPPCDVLKGIGPSIAKKLALRGVLTLEDLAYTLPTQYRDLRSMPGPTEVDEGEVAVVHGTITSFRQGYFNRRYMATLEVQPEAGDVIQARWFHRGGLGDRVKVGADITLVGPVKTFRDRPSMVHPDVYSPEVPPPPVSVKYPVVEGIGPKALARACRSAVAHGREHGWLVDVLPPAIAQEHGLPRLVEALTHLHEPDESLSTEEVAALAEARSPAHRRLAFEEFFLLQLSLARRRDDYCRGRSAMVVPDDAWDRERLRACLPFEPTSGQWGAIDDLAADLAAGPPMLRLLQGDVGSGKTAVAFAAALAVAKSGGQTALMAPTEILAEQHLRTLRPWCEAAGMKVALLTGATGKGERQTLLSLLSAGRIDLLLGTHALLVGDVTFARLGLAVVDEQHRFGVEQRATLRDKGERPHLLVMTATPIPRTLALSAYGELEVSIIDAMPPGRTPPVTRLYHGAAGLKRARSVLQGAVKRGSKAFVVCPLVEASEMVEASDVAATAEAVAAMLPEHRVVVVHGRMPPEEKDAVMTEFRDGVADVLVATTVIEVGVDVPDARLILVEHSERFGLSQLHQLRGRVGRGGGPCACLVHTASGPKSETGQRLAVLAETHDGFVVAERDLALRGPGEMFGTRQAGVPRLRFAGFGGEGTRMLVAARSAAQGLVADDPQLSEYPPLAQALARREGAAPIFSGDAG